MTMSIDNSLVVTFVAMDIAKHRHDVLVKHSGRISDAFKVANPLKDFHRFARLSSVSARANANCF